MTENPLIYIINEHVRYDSLSGSLFSPEYNPDTIQLSRPGNHILALFMENQNKLLTRDFLLTNVWESQGLDASNNSLNNHVSILRKAFARCGCDDIIKTVPKQGLIFTPQSITVESAIESVADENIRIEGTASLTPAVESKRKSRKKIYLSIVLLFICIIILLIPEVYKKITLSRLRQEVFAYRECLFYIADDNTKLLNKNFVKGRIDLFLEKHAPDCDQKLNVYFFYEKMKDAAGQELVSQLVSYCPYDSKAQCTNYQDYVK